MTGYCPKCRKNVEVAGVEEKPFKERTFERVLMVGKCPTCGEKIHRLKRGTDPGALKKPAVLQTEG